MTTTEKNKLIAEFMGWKFGKYKNLPDKAHKMLLDGEEIGLSLSQMNYHCSWDWLIPVVEKIEEMGSYTVMSRKILSQFEISTYNVKLLFQPNQDALLHLELRPYLTENTWKHPMFKNHIIKEFDFKNRSKVEAVHTACVEFILWYNQNKVNHDNR